MNYIDHNYPRAEVPMDNQEVAEVHIFGRSMPSGANYTTWRDYSKKPRIYVSVPETVRENLLNRRRRPHQEYRRIVRDVLTSLGVDSSVSFRWSQKAGCSCPCSPGFVLNTDPYLFGRVPADIYITLATNEKAADESQPTPVIVGPSISDEMLDMRLR